MNAKQSALLEAAIAGKVAPHEGREIQLVLDGTKPLAVIELNKQPREYEQAIAGIHGLFALDNWMDDTGWEAVITTIHNQALVLKYLDAVEMEESTAKHRTLGRLFGYSEADIEEFINNRPPCNCSKCCSK